MNVDYSQPFTSGPLDNGFDTYFGVDASNYPPYAFLRDRYTVGSDLVTHASPSGQISGNPTDAYNTAGPTIPGFDITNTLPTIISEATSYISSKANQANPFFAYLPLTAPHSPILPPVPLQGTTGKGPYGDFIATVDWAVGRVLDTLADPDNDPNTADSILDNTLVVFTADNGATKLFSFSTSTGSINGVPLRGEKAQIYEGGDRVPFLAQWPGHVPAGTVNNHIIELNDLLATAADLVGPTLLPANTAGDSYSILPELLGSASNPVRTTGISHSTNNVLAIRQVDPAGSEWKLIFSPGDGGYNDFQRVDPMVATTDFTKLQLYNLSSDPGEQTNLLSNGGSQSMQTKAMQLKKILQGYLASGQSKLIQSTTNNPTMLVDFGESSLKTNQVGWNNVSGGVGTRPVANLALFDQYGGSTGIVLKTSWSSSAGGVASVGSALYNGPYPPDLNGLPTSALSDGFFANNGTKLTISLESLDSHATYDLLFYGASASSGPVYSLFTVNGSTSQQVHISPIFNNSTQVAEVSGVLPNGQNQIQIEFEGRLANGAIGGGGWLNFMRIVEHLLEVPGDYNGDRLVDLADYTAWRNAFGNVGASLADGNHDGIVNSADFVVWRRAMGANLLGSGSSLEPTQNVPEPSTNVLTAIGVVGSCRASLRRRSRWPITEIT